MTDLKSKIEEAKNKTHMSLHQMSKAIGFNEHYLSAVVKHNRSEETQSKVIALLDDLIKKSQQELTHDFEGKALHKHIDDAMMISKSEYDSLLKQVDHKTQVAEKHADMRNKAELRVSELEKIVESRDKVISRQLLNSGNQAYKINELENQVKSLQKDFLNSDTDVGNLKEKLHLSEQDSEKWQCDYWTLSRENVELIDSKRGISIWLAVSILIIVAMAVCAVLHFNGVV